MPFGCSIFYSRHVQWSQGRIDSLLLDSVYIFKRITHFFSFEKIWWQLESLKISDSGSIMTSLLVFYKFKKMAIYIHRHNPNIVIDSRERSSVFFRFQKKSNVFGFLRMIT